MNQLAPTLPTVVFFIVATYLFFYLAYVTRLFFCLPSYVSFTNQCNGPYYVSSATVRFLLSPHQLKLK